MDGLTQILADASSVSPLFGILYAEDFDEIPSAPAADPEPPDDPVDPAPQPLTQGDLDQACAASIAAARRDWENEARHLRTDLLASINNVLAGAREAAEQVASSAAEALATTILAMLSGALPHFCNDHGAAEVQALLGHLLPTLRSEPRVVVRVHPDLVPELRREFLDLQVDFAGTLAVLPAPVERGDVKVEWQNGAISRDTRQLLQAMQDVLAQLGLQQPQNATPQRKMAHAE